MQKQVNGMNKSFNLSRQSSLSSQKSSSDKQKQNNSYISLSPRFDPEKGLAFENCIKEVKINNDETDEPQQQTQGQQKVGKIQKQSSFTLKTAKDESMKKSQFSRIQRADSLNPQKSQ
ncbi:unnamed protein product [Paramecium sonneborni]|uniref:Uncharacterized protein n=1 Tax=Paramecium sonneborni TaxID=65129 RepID=A0A8S1MQY7_9CILI|nr:unnamed protein product [Paramecium sonneborni]